MKKKLIAGVGGIILFSVVVVLTSVAGARDRTEARLEIESKMALTGAPRPVTCVPVEAFRLEEVRRYPGIVKASKESALSFRVGGPLTQANVTLGEPVKEGDLPHLLPRTLRHADQECRGADR